MSDPYRSAPFAPIATTQLCVAHGRKRVITVNGVAVVWAEPVEQLPLSIAPEPPPVELDRVALAEIGSVTLAWMGEAQVCELVLRDGHRRTITDGINSAAMDELMRTLHHNLRAYSGVTMTVGSWASVAIAVVGTVFMMVCLAGLWLDDWGSSLAYPFLVKGLVAFAVIAGPIVALRSRPRRYDPARPSRSSMSTNSP